MRPVRADRLLLACLLLACGSEAPPPTTSAPPTAAVETVPEAPPASAAPPTVAAPAVPPAASPASIDLLHAVPTTVTVSSVYRDDATQAARLTDGDLETAWNSRTGDLETAFVEITVPDGVTVTSIEMTAGYTKTSAHGDLFTGNHRIARVRVLRAGVPLGEQDLDVESRALQPIPLGGAGGTYRIEIVRLVPGTHADWRELCISELRVLGTADGTATAATTPTFAVAPEPDAGPPTEDDLAWEALEQRIDDYETRWEDDANGLTPREELARDEAAFDASLAAASPAVQAAVRCDWLDARLVARAFRLQSRLDHAATELENAERDVYDDGTGEVSDDDELDARSTALRSFYDVISGMMDRSFDEHGPRDAFAREVLAADRPAIRDVVADWDEMRALASDDVACTPVPLPD